MLVAPAATMEASMGTTAEAGSPSRGKPADISAVIKAAEGAGACPGLKVRRRRSAEPRTAAATVEGVTVTEAPAAEVSVIKSAAVKGSAVRDEGVMVVDCATALPVVSPVPPTPTKSSEVADAEADSKSNPYTAKKDSRHWIPAWIGDNRRSVH